LAVAILHFFLVTAPSVAQTFSHYAQLTVLDEPHGLRNVGMGTTGVSDMHSRANGYYNPASLAFIDRVWFSFEYQQFAEDISADLTFTDTRLSFGHQSGDSLASSWRVGGVLGYSTFAVDNEPFVIYLPEGPVTATDWRDYYVTAGFAASYQRYRESVAIGASLKRVELDTFGSGSWLFDYGLLVALTYRNNGSMIRPRIGFSSLNNDSGLEIDSTDYDIIGNWRIGAGVDFASTRSRLLGREVVIAAASIDFDRVSVDESRGPYWAIGFEGSMLELFHLRAGYRWYEVENRTVVSIGGGASWEFAPLAVLFDYARYSPYGAGPDQDMFSAAVGVHF
jgi:hypothetical protein